MSNLRDEIAFQILQDDDVLVIADNILALFNKHVGELLPKDNTSMSGYMTASLDKIAGYQQALDDIKAKLKE